MRQLHDHRARHPRQARRLPAVAEQGDRGAIDRGGQLGVGEMPGLRAQLEGPRANRRPETILAGRLPEMDCQAVSRAPRLTLDDRFELEPRRGTRGGNPQQPIRIVAVQEQVEPAAGSQRSGGRRHRVTKRSCFRAVGGDGRRAEERLEPQRLRRLATNEPRRGEVFEAQLVERRRRGWRAEHQVDPLRRQVLARHGWAAADPKHVRGAHAAQVVDVGREARRPPFAAQRGDSQAHVMERGLEEAPDVHLALVPRGGLAHLAAADAQRRDTSRVAVEAAPRQQAGSQRQAEDRGQRRVAQLAVDLGGDGLDRVEVARRVQRNQLVDELGSSVQDRKPVAQHLDVRPLADVGGRSGDGRFRADR